MRLIKYTSSDSECRQAPASCDKCMWYKTCLKIDPTVREENPLADYYKGDMQIVELSDAYRNLDETPVFIKPDRPAWQSPYPKGKR